MNRFWRRFIKPIMECVKPRRMMEIGADFGWNTVNLLAYCRASGAHLDIIDPAPRAELRAVLAPFDAEYTYIDRKSIDAIPLVATPDIALIDGDHNWYTVFTELTLLFARAAQLSVTPPIVLNHDVAWPYARRDMYYNPEDLRAEQRHPHAYRGMIPGSSELVEGGMNGVLANALHEGGPQNGVLTAIEDFIASNSVPVSFWKLPFFNGLGILVPKQRLTPELQRVIDGFFSAESLLETCQAIEEDAMRVRGELTATQIRLLKRTEALERARALLVK
jgi:predicted O-methyltransferase YrrM